MGGLNALPILKSQGADLRTGEQKEIEEEEALIYFTLFCKGSRLAKIETKIEILRRMQTLSSCILCFAVLCCVVLKLHDLMMLYLSLYKSKNIA
jgi:hypothetical protein